MDHGEYTRETGSKIAVLMIHGIAGTPAHFRDLIPVIPEHISVHSILLDGHGKQVKDFSATSMKKWKAQVSAKLEELFEKYEKVILIGHSMGTLFSIQAAIDHPEKIPFLFLLAVPVRPWVRFSTMLTCLRVVGGKLREDDAAAWAMKNATSIQLSSRIWEYIGWAPRMVELLAECERIRKHLPELNVPCYTFQSRVDELVSFSSCKDLEKNPRVVNTVLLHSGHFAYGNADKALLQKTLNKLLEAYLY